MANQRNDITDNYIHIIVYNAVSPNYLLKNILQRCIMSIVSLHRKEGYFVKLENTEPKSYRKWLVAIGCFMMIFLGLGFCSSNKSLYLGAITQALDIPRSLFALQDTMRFIITAIVNIFFGALVLKFGPKVICGVGFACFTGYLCISIFAENIILFYIAGCLLGIGTSFCSTAMVSYMVNMWFPEKRGTVSGAIMCANGLGGALAAQIISPLIDASKFGYRNAYAFALLMTVITGITVVILIAKPKGVQGNIAKKKARGAMWSGISAKQALRKPYFYLAILCVFLTGMALQGIYGIAAVHMKDIGINASFVATVLSVGSLVLTGSKFISGLSYDKLGLRATLAFCEICGICGFVCLALCGPTSGGHVLAMGYTVLSSLALPLETVMIPLITADLFGEKDFGKLLGYFVAANYSGYAAGGFVFNLVFDMTGSYVSMLLITAAMMLGVLVTFQFILNAAQKIKNQVMAQE